MYWGDGSMSQFWRWTFSVFGVPFFEVVHHLCQATRAMTSAICCGIQFWPNHSYFGPVALIQSGATSQNKHLLPKALKRPSTRRLKAERDQTERRQSSLPTADAPPPPPC